MNDVLHRVPAESAARVCARSSAHLASSTASFIIPQDVVACSIMCRRRAHMRPRRAYVRKEERDHHVLQGNCDFPSTECFINVNRSS